MPTVAKLVDPMVPGDADEPSLHGHDLGVQSDGVRRQPQERDVHQSLAQRGHLAAPVEAFGLHAHLGIALGEDSVRAGTQRAGAGGGEPHPQVPGRCGLDRTDRALGRLPGVDQLPGRGQQRLAGRGESYVPGGALEQRATQFLLELTDLPAQRRLGDEQPLGGTGEAQLFGDRHEIAQHPGVDVQPFPRSIHASAS